PAASPAASPSPVARSRLSVPANDPSIDGQDITFPGADGATIMAYQARLKSSSGPLPLVLVCHENRGLTEHIRDVVRRFAKEGYTACGVDLVSRQGGTAKSLIRISSRRCSLARPSTRTSLSATSPRQ